MTETLSEFRQRVARLQKEHPSWRYGQAVAMAMIGSSCGARDEQAEWMISTGGVDASPYYEDARIGAFLRAAIEAGVLLDDTAQERQDEASRPPQLPSPWVWYSPTLAVGGGLDIGRIEERDGKFRLAGRVGDMLLTGVPYTKLADAQEHLAVAIQGCVWRIPGLAWEPQTVRVATDP